MHTWRKSCFCATSHTRLDPGESGDAALQGPVTWGSWLLRVSHESVNHHQPPPWSRLTLTCHLEMKDPKTWPISNWWVPNIIYFIKKKEKMQKGKKKCPNRNDINDTAGLYATNYLFKVGLSMNWEWSWHISFNWFQVLPHSASKKQFKWPW